MFGEDLNMQVAPEELKPQRASKRGWQKRYE